MTLKSTSRKGVWDENSWKAEIFFGNWSVPLQEGYFHIPAKICHKFAEGDMYDSFSKYSHGFKH